MSKLTAAIVLTASVVIAGGLVAAALIIVTDDQPAAVVQTTTTAPSTTTTSTTPTTSTTTTAVPSTTVDIVCNRLLEDQDDLLAESLLAFQQQHADAISSYDELIASYPDDLEAQATLEEGKQETLRQMRAQWEYHHETLMLQMDVDAARLGCLR